MSGFLADSVNPAAQIISEARGPDYFRSVMVEYFIL